MKLDVWTIKAVSQDDFEDVIVPDTPVQPTTEGASSVIGRSGLK